MQWFCLNIHQFYSGNVAWTSTSSTCNDVMLEPFWSLIVTMLLKQSWVWLGQSHSKILKVQLWQCCSNILEVQLQQGCSNGLEVWLQRCCLNELQACLQDVSLQSLKFDYVATCLNSFEDWLQWKFAQAISWYDCNYVTWSLSYDQLWWRLHKSNHDNDCKLAMPYANACKNTNSSFAKTWQ